MGEPLDWVLDQAREVLRIEAQALLGLGDQLDRQFVRAVELVLCCQGRVVVTGMGKSGSVGRKIASTLASTGTPALFLHPAEGVHGDLGMVSQGDLLVALSYSGESDEIVSILPAVKRIAVPIIALTGRPASTLGEAAEAVLSVAVEREACPLGLAPTTSTTAMLAMGDALAVAVMRARNFSAEDFARLHPAGSLGRRLLLKAGDIMRAGDQVAAVGPSTLLKDVLFAITSAHAGAALVLDGDGRLAGIVTDGDIRRRLLADEGALRRPVSEAMVASPKTISADRLCTEALQVMEEYKIGELPVLDGDRRPLGVLNLKDLLRAGIV